MATATLSLDTFSSVVSRAWTWTRRILWAALVIAGAIVALEIVHVYDLLARVHPVLAWTVIGALGVALLGWTGWATMRYLRTPRVIVPPDLPPVETGWSEAERAAYRDFATRYLRRQLGNPHLADEAKARIPASMEAVARPLPADVARDPVRAAAELRGRVDAEIAPILAPLDERARRMIRRAAVEVSLATAVSPSILLDSLITLTRNVDLISRLADLYYGRPGLLGTLRVTRDVLGSAVAAGALEVVSDHVSGALTEMTGSWSTRLIGPLGQGLINGVVTMRLGAATQQRCRSLTTRRVIWKPWKVSNYRHAMSALVSWLGEDVGPWVFGPLGRMAEWTGKTARATANAGRDTVRGWWDRLRRTPRGEEDGPDETGRTAPSDRIPSEDPVRESGLLD